MIKWWINDSFDEGYRLEGGKIMTKIWAHRGASQDAPENTMEAFALAVEQQADGIETDVHMTRDGVVVIMHDETLDRTTDKQGNLKDWDYADLLSVNANNHRKDYPFCHIPRLEELLALVKENHLELNIELKTDVYAYKGIEAKVVSLVKAYGLEDQVIYSSFNHYSLMCLRQIEPTSKIGLLYMEGLYEPWKYATALKADALHPYYPCLNIPSYVKKCHHLGIAVHPWTINDERTAKKLMNMGVDALITNVPAKLVALKK